MIQQAQQHRLQITIPKGIYDAIVALRLHEDQNHKAFTFCSQLLTYQEWNEGKKKYWIDFSRDRFREEYGYSYLNGFIKPLEENGIIEIKKKASKHNKKAYGYHINDDLTYSQHELIDLDKYIHNAENKTTSDHLKDFTAFVNSINIPLKELINAVVAKIDSLPNDIVLDEAIPNTGDSYKYKTANGKWDSKKLPTILKHATKYGKQAILYKEKIYVSTKEKFIADKTLDIKKGSKAILRNLGYKSYYANVDNTGGRLHHNFTNLPSYLFDIICKKNNLVEVDASSAQPVFLIHLLGKDADPLFYEKATTGTLYQYIAQQLYESVKDEYIKRVKLMVMNALFDDSTDYTSKHRVMLGKVFPKLMEAILKKEANDKENISVQLQRYEANLFVKTLLPRLKEKGILCCTKHDALIFKYSKEHLKGVINIIREVMKEQHLNMVFKVHIYGKGIKFRFDQNSASAYPHVNTPKPNKNAA